jgi:hypothetical protein
MDELISLLRLNLCKEENIGSMPLIVGRLI